VQRPLRGGQVLQVGGAGVAGPDQREDPGPRGLGRGDQRLQRVAAEQRVGGEGIRPEARDRPPRSRRLADQRLGVGGGADRDVAALAVGDDQQPGVASRPADLGQRCPPGRTEPLEAGELWLDGDAGRSGALDQRAAVRGNRRSRPLGDRRVVAGRIGKGLPAQLRRVGVEAEADLATALLDKRRQPIGERAQIISRP
jgi:hypothetical protein